MPTVGVVDMGAWVRRDIERLAAGGRSKFRPLSEPSVLGQCWAVAAKAQIGSSLSIGAGSADQLRLLEEVGMELRSRVEDLDPDEPAVLPVEDDEGVDARRCSRWDAVAT